MSLAAALVAALPARADTPALTPVSATPYASPVCSSNATDGEVSVAVDPATGQRVAAWMQDVAGLSDPAGQPLDTSDVIAAESRDGRTWTQAAAPAGTMVCDAPPGPSDVAYDPTVSVGPDHRWYLANLGADGAPGVGATYGRIFVHTSTDGVHWSPVVASVPDPGDDDFASVVADPVVAGRAYVTASSFVLSPVQLIDAATPPAQSAAVISTTTDGGTTWSAPTTIHRAGSGTLVIGSRLVVVDGTLLDVFAEGPDTDFATRTGTYTLYATRSTDRGATWSSPLAIGTGNLTDIGTEVVPCCTMSLAGSPSRRRAALAWVRNTSDASSGVYLASTADAGATWSVSHLHRATAVFGPTVAVNAGRTALLWYDFAGPKPPGELKPTTTWLARPSRRKWNVRRLSAAFDLAGDNLFFSAALGDYQSLVPLGTGFEATFTVGPPLARRGRTDIVTTAIP